MVKKLTILIFLLASLSTSGVLLTQKAFAADCATGDTTCTPADCAAGDTTTCTSVGKKPSDCASGEVDKSDPPKCIPIGDDCNTGASDCLKNSPFTKRLNQIVTFLSAGVGIIVVGVIVVGGIQYSLAGGAPDKVKAARQRIANGLIAMLAFILAYGLLQWIIPGGVFGS